MKGDRSLTTNSQFSTSNSQLPKGYKQTEVGVIPDDWEASLLGKFMVLQRGYDLPHRERKEGSIPIITSSGFGGTHSEPKVSCPGVVTGRYGTIGDVFYIQENFWPLNTTLYVKDFCGNDPLFSSYLLKTIDFHTHSGKSGVPGVNRNDLHEIRIPIPPIAEQNLIARALSDTDALIESLEQLLAKKRQIKQGTMQELLTGKSRVQEFGKGKGYKQTELGLIPDDWILSPLGNLGQFKNGINKGSEAFGHGFPFVNLMDVFGASQISSVDSCSLVDTNNVEQQTYELKRGDVLFVRSSVKPSGVGLAAVVEADLPKTVYSGFLIRFRDNNTIVQEFKRYCFYEESFRKRLIAASSVSANTNINQDNLKQLLVALPSTENEQKAIATILSDMDLEIGAIETKLTKARQLKQGMMHELLTGKIRLIDKGNT